MKHHIMFTKKVTSREVDIYGQTRRNVCGTA